MKLSKTILFFCLIASLLTFFSNGLSAKELANCCYKGAVNKATDGHGSKRDGDAILKKSVTAEGFFIKTAGQSSLTTRLEERSITDAFFISFFAYSKTIKYTSVSTGSGFIHFEPQQQKIIFPHHHFW